ncbi:mucin-4-like [Paramacrobiotus metropolitanus]|uniref:mucin-4-like n=1 Tax=Paramacrobiotus metropolitanus TaxID=2943436 RepID=UPI002445A9DA|nr:mucin-4-like [Paramacrobiotus metropolitanus]
MEVANRIFGFLLWNLFIICNGSPVDTKAISPYFSNRHYNLTEIRLENSTSNGPLVVISDVAHGTRIRTKLKSGVSLCWPVKVRDSTGIDHTICHCNEISAYHEAAREGDKAPIIPTKNIEVHPYNTDATETVYPADPTTAGDTDFSTQVSTELTNVDHPLTTPEILPLSTMETTHSTLDTTSSSDLSISPDAETGFTPEHTSPVIQDTTVEISTNHLVTDVTTHIQSLTSEHTILVPLIDTSTAPVVFTVPPIENTPSDHPVTGATIHIESVTSETTVPQSDISPTTQVVVTMPIVGNIPGGLPFFDATIHTGSVTSETIVAHSDASSTTPVAISEPVDEFRGIQLATDTTVPATSVTTEHTTVQTGTTIAHTVSHPVLTTGNSATPMVAESYPSLLVPRFGISGREGNIFGSHSRLLERKKREILQDEGWQQVPNVYHIYPWVCGAGTPCCFGEPRQTQLNQPATTNTTSPPQPNHAATRRNGYTYGALCGFLSFILAFL